MGVPAVHELVAMRRVPAGVPVPEDSVVRVQVVVLVAPVVPVVDPVGVPVPVVGQAVSVALHVGQSVVVVVTRTSCSRSTSR